MPSCEGKDQVKKVKRYRDANIKVVANGFIITIGCQTVVAESAENLLSLIKEYLDNPDVAEERLLKDTMAKLPANGGGLELPSRTFRSDYGSPSSQPSGSIGYTASNSGG